MFYDQIHFEILLHLIICRIHHFNDVITFNIIYNIVSLCASYVTPGLWTFPDSQVHSVLIYCLIHSFVANLDWVQFPKEICMQPTGPYRWEFPHNEIKDNNWQRWSLLISMAASWKKREVRRMERQVHSTNIVVSVCLFYSNRILFTLQVTFTFIFVRHHAQGTIFSGIRYANFSNWYKNWSTQASKQLNIRQM